MAEAKTEVSGYHITSDQHGRYHIVAEHTEYVYQSREDRLRHGWQRYITTHGIRLEPMEEGVFVSVAPPGLLLQRTYDFQRLCPETGLRMER